MRLTTLFEATVPSIENKRYEDDKARYLHICSKLKFIEKRSFRNSQAVSDGIDSMISKYGVDYVKSQDPTILAFMKKLRVFDARHKIDAKTIKNLELSKKTHELADDVDGFFGNDWMDD